MTKYEIYCAECRRKTTIDNPRFTEIANSIEEQTSEMTCILSKNGIPVSYKSHEHISYILQSLMRCCAKPEIYFTEVRPLDEVDRIIEECRKKRLIEARVI